MNTPHQIELCQRLGFTADDLAHNRRGYLSPRQIQRVRRWACVVACIALLGLFFPVVFTTLHGSFWQLPQFYARLFGMGLLIAAAVWSLRRYAHLLAGPILQSADVHPAQANVGQNVVFRLENNRQLHLSPALYQCLLPSQTYRLYYTDYLPSANWHSAHLVSLEPVYS
ncbi:MAG TPA: hypothetical protein VHP83_07890 [Aggregatilineaceae bacterium]|nr:hypothetical protein [Aggregatilineaceae bacterium]